MKKHWSTILLVVIFVIGLSLLLYPTLSNYWNSFHSSRAIASYTEAVTLIDTDKYEEILAEAEEYNESLGKKSNPFLMSEEELATYNSLLDVTGSGIMGYIEIPKIKVDLPIYHTVDETVLQVGAGHLEGTSLPIGGPGTHSAISGHRGLPSARLFTDLDQIVVGDIFMIRILDEVRTYEVDQILVVDPQDMSPLAIEEGKDYCTLITCTPYGVNSHRMLVRGTRIENQLDHPVFHVTAEASQIDPIIVTPIVALPMLLVLLVWLLIKYRRR